MLGWDNYKDLSENIRELVEFFFYAYLITWLFWIPIILSNAGILPFTIPQVFFLAGAFGPVTSSLIVTSKYHGAPGIKLLLEKLVRVKHSFKWYLFALLLPVAIVMSVLLGLYLFHGSVQDLQFKSFDTLAGIFFGSLIICANEEVSWRGFALPRLQRKCSAFYSSVILGFFWGMIHFPLFFIQPERTGGFRLLFIVPGFVLMCIFLSIIYTFQYNSTRGSVLLATLFHTSLNTSNELYSSPSHAYDTSAMFLFLGAVAFVAGCIVIIFGKNNLAATSRLNE
jgi:membrane protease YdiL (CAAX protease family)